MTWFLFFYSVSDLEGISNFADLGFKLPTTFSFFAVETGNNFLILLLLLNYDCR